MSSILTLIIVIITDDEIYQYVLFINEEVHTQDYDLLLLLSDPLTGDLPSRVSQKYAHDHKGTVNQFQPSKEKKEKNRTVEKFICSVTIYR